jgi:hypothetical protein
VQCTDDSTGAWSRFNSRGEGDLLRKLQDGLLFGPESVRSLRIGEDRGTGSASYGAVGPRTGPSGRIGRVARTVTNAKDGDNHVLLRKTHCQWGVRLQVAAE